MNRSRPITATRILNGKPATRLLILVLAVAGFALQGLLPGLDLAFRGDFYRTAFGTEAAICHSSPSDSPSSDGKGQSDSHGCCLVCQVAGLANDVPPSPTFTRPTLGTASLPTADGASHHVDRRASRQHPPRAPPAAVA